MTASMSRPPREGAVFCRLCPRPLRGARPTIWSHSGLCTDHEDREAARAAAEISDAAAPAVSDAGPSIPAATAGGAPPVAPVVAMFSDTVSDGRHVISLRAGHLLGGSTSVDAGPSGLAAGHDHGSPWTAGCSTGTATRGAVAGDFAHP